MTTAIIPASRKPGQNAERRIAIDGNGLRYPVIVEDGLVHDAAIFPFPYLSPGMPIDQVQLADDQA